MILTNLNSKNLLFVKSKLIHKSLIMKPHFFSKVDFFLSISNSKSFARNFSTNINLNLPKLHEQKERSLLFFLDGFWEAEETLVSRYCLIMLLSFKKYLNSTVQTSPIKSKMDLNLIRKYVKLVLLYLRNTLVSDIDRINSKFLIFFYFLTKTTNFMSTLRNLSQKKMLLRNLFFIFILSKGRLTYFFNLTTVNNVLSKNYISFQPKIKYVTSTFPTGLFLLLYSPYKYSFSLGSSGFLYFKHNQFMKKLFYLNSFFQVHVEQRNLLNRNFESFSRIGVKSSLVKFSFLKNSVFLKHSRILYQKISKKFNLKIKNKYSQSISKKEIFFANQAKKSINTSTYRYITLKQNFSPVITKNLLDYRTKLLFRKNVSNSIFLSPVFARLVVKMMRGLLNKLRYNLLKINFFFGNRFFRTFYFKLLKRLLRYKARIRQFYKLFQYSFLSIRKNSFNSLNKFLVLLNSLLNFSKFGKNALSFLNIYKLQSFSFRKFIKFLYKKPTRLLSSVNSKVSTKDRLSFLISNKGVLVYPDSLNIVNVRSRKVDEFNSLLNLHASFVLLNISSFVSKESGFIDLKRVCMSFFTNTFFREVRVLIFSKLFHFDKFLNIFFFYMNILKFIKFSIRFNVIKNGLFFFPFFFHYSSRFLTNNFVFLQFLDNRLKNLVDNFVLSYRNLFNNFIRVKLFRFEQLYLSKDKRSEEGTEEQQYLLLKKKLISLKYIKKTPVQKFIIERQNLRNLESITDAVKRFVARLKSSSRQKNTMYSSVKAIQLIKVSDTENSRSEMLKKKKVLLKRINKAPVSPLFESKIFKKKYALYKAMRKRYLKKLVIQKRRSKYLKSKFNVSDFVSNIYIHRFYFRKRISRKDYRRVKRRFFVNLLFFSKMLKEKRIMYSYYKLGKKGFRMASLQKVSNPFFLRLKLKRYLVSDKYKRILNRFSFLNSSYGFKASVTRFTNLSFINFSAFFSNLDKFRILKFFFSKTSDSIFYKSSFLGDNQVICHWLTYLKNFYFSHIFHDFQINFSVFSHLLDYIFLLRFFFYKGFFFVSKKLCAFLAEFSIVLQFMQGVKQIISMFFLTLARIPSSSHKISLLSVSSKVVPHKRFYSTSVVLKRVYPKCSENSRHVNGSFKFRFYFLVPTKALCSNKYFLSNYLFNTSISKRSGDLVGFSDFVQTYLINARDFMYSKTSSFLYIYFRNGFCKLQLNFFPRIFLFFNFLNKCFLKFSLLKFKQGLHNVLFYGIGFFTFLYSTLRDRNLRVPKYFSGRTLRSPRVVRKKTSKGSTYYKKRKSSKFKYTSRKQPINLKWRAQRELQAVQRSHFKTFRLLKPNAKGHFFFVPFLLGKILRRKSRKLRYLQKNKLPFKKVPVYFSENGKGSVAWFRNSKILTSTIRKRSFLNYNFGFDYSRKNERSFGVNTFYYNLKWFRSKLRKRNVVFSGFSVRVDSVSFLNNLVTPTILYGDLFRRKLDNLFDSFKSNIYPFKKIFFYKKHLYNVSSFSSSHFSNSKLFLANIYILNSSFFLNFYSFSLSKINHVLINFKTQRFIRLLSLLKNSFLPSNSDIVSVNSGAVQLSVKNLSECVFVLDFFELLYDASEVDSFDLALMDHFVSLCVVLLPLDKFDVFHFDFFCFYDFFKPLTVLLSFYFQILDFKNEFLIDSLFLGNIKDTIINSGFVLGETITEHYSDLILPSSQYDSLGFSSFERLGSIFDLYYYMINYFRYKNRATNVYVMPLKLVYSKFDKSFIDLLCTLNLIEITSSSRKFNQKNLLYFKNSFFLFLNNVLTFLLERFLNMYERSLVNFSQEFVSFVVNFFMSNFKYLSSHIQFFKKIIDISFGKAFYYNFERLSLKVKLKYLRVLVLNNQKIFSLFKNSIYNIFRFKHRSIPFSVNEKFDLKIPSSKTRGSQQLISEFSGVQDNSNLVSVNSNSLVTAFSAFIQNFSVKNKLSIVEFKSLRKFNKYFTRKKKLRRRFIRFSRRRFKKRFFAEFYNRILQTKGVANTQIHNLLLLRKAANLKLFSRVKKKVEIPSVSKFVALKFKSELEPVFSRLPKIQRIKRATLRRRHLFIKKRFHPLVKKNIVVGFFMSPRFLAFKNFPNSGFFLKVNFDVKVKQKLALFLRLNRFMEFIFRIILRVKLYLKKHAFLSNNSVKSNLVLSDFFSNDFYFYIVKVYRKLKLLTMSFLNKLSVFYVKINGFDERLTQKLNFRVDNLKFLFFYNFLSSKFLKLFVLRYFFFGQYIKYRFQFINRFLWFRVLPLNSFLLTPKVFIIITKVKNNFFITGIDLYGRILYKTSPGIVHFTGSDRVSKYAWFEASVDFFDGFLEFFRYFLKSRKRKKISYTSLRISREININFNRKKKKYGPFLHPLYYFFAHKRKQKKKARKRRLKSKIFLRRFFVISKGISDFNLRTFIKGMLNERFYVSKYFAGAVNYPMKSFSLCRIKKVRRV